MAGVLRHAPERVVQIWIRSGSKRLMDLRETARNSGIAVLDADDHALERLVGDARHQGVVAEFLPRPAVDEAALADLIAKAGEKALVLMLDGVQDPHNLGACLRTAAAAGATAVVIPKDRAVGLTPAARRAAAGAAEVLPLAEVTNLARCMDALADAGVWRVGLAGEADGSLYSADFAGPLALVAGSEESGLRRLTREHCDRLVHIPMAGGAGSLNVSVAIGIALFEANRQRLNI